MSHPPSIVWFRQDLRLSDQPALAAALQRPGPVIPVFIWSPDEEGHWSLGGASSVWLHHSLHSLKQTLERLGNRLVIRKGPICRMLHTLCAESGAKSVVWCRRYEPAAISHDTNVKEELRAAGIHAESFNGSLLLEPWEVQTKEGRPYQVFTPFWKACQSRPEPDEPLPAPTRILSPRQWPESVSIDDLRLLPKLGWDKGILEGFTPGEQGALGALSRFVNDAMPEYAETRDRPDCTGTSRLSPHLHFGEISPRQVWNAVVDRTAAEFGQSERGAERFLAEIGWREFAHHLLFHFPHTISQPLREQYSRFPWRKDQKSLRAWQQGKTGYPLVDAGMRQLWQTGWMHNRVRMVAASFLVKHLLLPWQEGARWFWDTLVDANLANNTLGWQWVAGCGADAAPYFRIFNPTAQGEKFDPQGSYVKQWVPELAAVPTEFIHEPNKASPGVLKAAHVELGRTYPMPIVDHALARERALDALATIKQQG